MRVAVPEVEGEHADGPSQDAYDAPCPLTKQHLANGHNDAERCSSQ
jgi:hypothetical protein